MKGRRFPELFQLPVKHRSWNSLGLLFVIARGNWFFRREEAGHGPSGSAVLMFFPEACQQDAYWSHAHPLTGYWLSREGLMWSKPTCTKQNRDSLSKVEEGHWLLVGGAEVPTVSLSAFMHTSPWLVCMRVDHWLCSSNVNTSVWVWPPLVAVEAKENRSGSSCPPSDSKAAQNAPCHLLAVRSPPYSSEEA